MVLSGVEGFEVEIFPAHAPSLVGRERQTRRRARASPTLSPSEALCFFQLRKGREPCRRTQQRLDVRAQSPLAHEAPVERARPCARSTLSQPPTLRGRKNDLRRFTSARRFARRRCARAAWPSRVHEREHRDLCRVFRRVFRRFLAPVRNRRDAICIILQ